MFIMPEPGPPPVRPNPRRGPAQGWQNSVLFYSNNIVLFNTPEILGISSPLNNNYLYCESIPVYIKEEKNCGAYFQYPIWHSYFYLFPSEEGDPGGGNLIQTLDLLHAWNYNIDNLCSYVINSNIIFCRIGAGGAVIILWSQNQPFFPLWLIIPVQNSV